MLKFYTPKKILFLLALISFCFIVNNSISSASGPPIGYTGAPGESNCTSCHSGTVNNGAYNSGVKIITNMPNNHYALNTTYQITVRLVTKNCVKFGFETTALNTSNVTVGTLSVTNATTTQKYVSGSKQYIAQTSSGTSPSYTDSTDWTFNWTSPTSNAGDITFYMNGNVTNNSNSDVGDTIYAKSFTFPFYNPPQGAIGATSTNICVSDSVRFTGSGNNSPTGWTWTFPGGNPTTSNLQSLWVKFAFVGTSLCSLYVSNSSGSSPLITKTINISSYPTASLASTGSTTFCQGDSVLLTGTSSPNCTYLWLNNGVSTGLTANPIYMKNGGSYTLKVTNAGGCSVVTNAVSVIVNPIPTAILTNSGLTTFCVGDSVLLKLTGSAGNTKQWYNGTTLLNGISDTFYYAKTNGIFSVTLTNTALCAATSNSIQVTVNTFPTATFTSAPSGCIFILTANSGPGLKYQWYKNDTAILNDTGISHTLNVNGTYKVRVTNASGCSVFSSSQTMNVANLPDVTLTIAGSTIFCIGDSVSISVPQNSAYTYQWFKNGNSLLKDTLAKIVLKDSGLYLVKINNGTCTNISNGTAINILSFPDTTILANTTTFCIGDSALLTAKQGTGYVYQWFKNDTLIPVETNSTLKIKAAGNYNVNISNGHCNRSSSKTNVRVNPLPAVPVISRDKQTLTSVSAFHYQWYKDGNIITTAQSQSFTPTADGKYKVIITDSNGCSNSSVDYNYALTGIASNTNPFFVKLFPIPASEFITLETNSSSSLHLMIFNACGKKILEQNISDSRTIIDVKDWSKGIYMMYLEDGENRKFVKFVAE